MYHLSSINNLKHLCAKYGLAPSKKYGQNFLIDPEPINKMIEAADVGPNDTVVEIGPGFGPLTFALAEKAKKVLAFEIEKKLIPYWESFGCHSDRASQRVEESLGFGVMDSSALRSLSRLSRGSAQNDKCNNLEIIWGNVLHEVESPKSKVQSLGKYKVIANIPYQITSEVIRKFLEAPNKPDLMVLMVQKEVAERICAKAGDMSVLAVSVQLYAEPEIIMPVPRSSFWPQPKVDSAVIKLSIKQSECFYPPLTKRGQGGVAGDGGTSATPPNLLLERGGNDEDFFKIVKAGFANRRKMLIKNLSTVADKKKLPALFHELGINEKARAQELSVEQWQELVSKLSFHRLSRGNPDNFIGY